ncbi:MAG: hypothetical protein IH845_05425 [Nanoarchaeota archaeon]|nr:hypothetical protein [Nanoarchaeota archaeon]
MRGKLTRTVFFGLFSLFTFLVLLFVANYSLRYIQIEFYSALVHFFNANIRVVIFISLLFMFSRMSDLFVMPVNLFSPLFKSVGAGVLIIFLSDILKFIISLSDNSFPWILKWINILTDPLVFVTAIIIFVVGYFKIIYQEITHKDGKYGSVETKPETKEEKLKRKNQIPVWIKFRSFVYKLRLKIKNRFK